MAMPDERDYGERLPGVPEQGTHAAEGFPGREFVFAAGTFTRTYRGRVYRRRMVDVATGQMVGDDEIPPWAFRRINP